MRLGVLDVGSNTVHLLLIDGRPGARPEPYASHKIPLQLVQYLDAEGNISQEGADALTRFVTSARDFAIENEAEDLLAFSTSAIREAGNGAAVLQQVREQTGVSLNGISGDQEAAITYFAVRRWQGWGAGRILDFDIGGGSFEFSTGTDALPVKRLRKYVREQIAPVAENLLRYGAPDMTVGTSKTFRSLARICGAAPYSAGPHVKREMHLQDLRLWTRRMEAMTVSERADLPGVSKARAEQMLAGAIAAEAAMEAFGIETMRVCPWALREGLILRRIEHLAEGTGTPVNPKTLLGA